MNRDSRSLSASTQRGSVLLVAVVLLLLAGIMTLAALNVGVFESRSTANDLRAKAVADVAEAGLARGFEYLLRQHPDMLKNLDLTIWEKCGPSEVTFPCGAVGGVDPDSGQPRRAAMYKLRANGQSIAGLDAALTQRMLKLNDTVGLSGGYSAVYGVAPVVCWVKAPAATDTTVRCTTDEDEATAQRIVTFVSVAAIPDEGARTTLTQTVGKYNLLQDLGAVPPITATGLVDITGNIQVVTNANGGGPGVPVSVWTRKDVKKHGTPNTCYAEEFFRYGGAKGNSGKTPTSSPAIWEGTAADGTGGTLTCDTCNCAGDQSLSFNHSGASIEEGMDILDIDGDAGLNRDVKPEEFPCDLFGFVFGVQAWTEDPSQPSDNFCETRMPKVAYTSPSTGLPVSMNVDEAYLYANAEKIYAPDANDGLLKTSQEPEASLDSGSSGLIWCQAGQTCGLSDVGRTIGSPDAPVVVVADGDVKLSARVFGVVFVRSTGEGPLDASDGGDASLEMNSNKAAVYGAVIVQGIAEKLNGGVIVSDPTVLDNIGSNPNNARYATLPGAWNDRRSY